MYGLISDNELYHHGILGMKWGVRRYQNKDGTLTSAGKKRYSDSRAEDRKATTIGKKALRRWEELSDEYDNRINKALEDDDYNLADKLDNEYEDKIYSDVYSQFEKAGYDLISRGTGSDNLRKFQFGKYSDDGKEFIEYMFTNRDNKAYRLRY